MVEIKELKMPRPETMVPIVLKTLAIITTIRIWVTRLCQKPLRVAVSLARSSKSLTFGLRMAASVRPANHPAANKGLREVIGAATNAVNMDKG